MGELDKFPLLYENYAGPMALAERVESTRKFTIRVKYVPPAEAVLEITALTAPTELAAGVYPRVLFTFVQKSTKNEYVFWRVIDEDTGAEVAIGPPATWMTPGTYNREVSGGPYPFGQWKVAMPDKDWNLRLELVLWWL